MKIKVVGIKNVDYFSNKKNRQVTGKEIHYVDLGTQRSGLDGHQVGTQYIGSDNPCAAVPITLGGTYTMYLNGYSVDYLAEDNGK